MQLDFFSEDVVQLRSPHHAKDKVTVGGHTSKLRLAPALISSSPALDPVVVELTRYTEQV